MLGSQVNNTHPSYALSTRAACHTSHSFRLLRVFFGIAVNSLESIFIRSLVCLGRIPDDITGRNEQNYGSFNHKRFYLLKLKNAIQYRNLAEVLVCLPVKLLCGNSTSVNSRQLIPVNEDRCCRSIRVLPGVSHLIQWQLRTSSQRHAECHVAIWPRGSNTSEDLLHNATSAPQEPSATQDHSGHSQGGM